MRVCLDHNMNILLMCLGHKMNTLFVCLSHKMGIRSSPQFLCSVGAGWQKNRFLYRFYSQHDYLQAKSLLCVAWPVHQMHDLQSSVNSMGKGGTRRRTKEEVIIMRTDRSSVHSSVKSRHSCDTLAVF